MWYCGKPNLNQIPICDDAPQLFKHQLWQWSERVWWRGNLAHQPLLAGHSRHLWHDIPLLVRVKITFLIVSKQVDLWYVITRSCQALNHHFIKKWDVDFHYVDITLIIRYDVIITLRYDIIIILRYDIIITSMYDIIITLRYYITITLRYDIIIT